MVIIDASLLAADYSQLGREMERAEVAGVDFFHFDVMDGHYVRNYAFAPDHVKAVRKCSKLPFILHLAVTDPQTTLKLFEDQEFSLIFVHADSMGNPKEVFAHIKGLGARVGLALKPDETINQVLNFLPEIDILSILSVQPGFGKQKPDPRTPQKVDQASQIIKSSNLDILIAVDGGIYLSNYKELIDSGARHLIIGTGLFMADDMTEVVRLIKMHA